MIHWDYKSGKGPECLGILSSQDINFNGATCLCLDKKNDRLYIPEDKKYFAEIHFETGSATWSKFLLISLLCVGGFFLLMELVPMLLGVLDGFIGSM